MTAQVISLAEILDAREKAYWDAQARAVGFKDFAALEDANAAEFDAQYEWLQAICTHDDKLPQLGMCVDCAERLQA